MRRERRIDEHEQPAAAVVPGSLRGSLDSLPFVHDDSRLPNGASGRRPCRRHTWHPSGVSTFADGAVVAEPTCTRCGHVRNQSRIRRGRTARRSGNDAERDLAHRLGGRRVGQYGTSVDVEVGEYMVVQSKRGRSFPERLWKLTQELPHDGRLRAVYVSDAPGPGHARRELLVIPLADFLSWHGPEDAA